MCSGHDSEDVLGKTTREHRSGAGGCDGQEFDMLDDSLAMTAWERILANDDMVNFGDSLRAAMEERNAKPR